VFHLDYKKFMIGGNEPSYLRATKIRLLKLTTNSQNFADIVNELAEYLFDEDVSYEAVNVLSELVASSNETDAKFIAKTVVKTV
jgi:signal recognition particle GTPase